MAPQTRRLRLPSVGEALETRVVAYRELAVTPHRNWSGWRMRAGYDGDIREVNDVRSWMQNSPESRRVFDDYDSTRRLGFGLLGAGLVATLVGPTALAVMAGGRSTSSSSTRLDSGSVAALSLVTLAGAVVLTIAAVIVGGTEHFVPEAAEAYNLWLWRRLGLPERLAVGTVEEIASAQPETDAGVAPPAVPPAVPPGPPVQPTAPASGLAVQPPW